MMNRRSFLQRAAGIVAVGLAAVYAPSLKAVAVATRQPTKYKLRTLHIAGQTIPIPDSVPELSEAEVDDIVCKLSWAELIAADAGRPVQLVFPVEQFCVKSRTPAPNPAH